MLQIKLTANLVGGCGVQHVGEVLALLLEGRVLDGQAAEALLQVQGAGCARGVRRLPVEQKEHQADNDQRLDERGEEEDDAHVVAAALVLGAVLHLFLRLLALLADLRVATAVHGHRWRAET